MQRIALQASSPWQRQYVVESSTFRNQQKVDMVRVTPDAQAEDQGAMYEYLFGGTEPFQENDSLMLGYFEQSPGEALMSKMLELAQEMGKPLIWETLGIVPKEIQDSVERLGATNFTPGIWGDGRIWDENTPKERKNPYHPQNILRMPWPLSRYRIQLYIKGVGKMK